MAKLGPTNVFGTLNVSSTAKVGSLVVDTELFAQNTQKVFHDAYHPNADKWTTARTLNLSGDASGSVSWDGSSDVTLNVTVADDSHTHDTRYVQKTGDTMTGVLKTPKLQSVPISDLDTYGDDSGYSFGYSPSSTAGAPIGTDHAILTQSYNSSWQTQMASDWRTNNWFVRSQNNGSWGSWAQLFSDSYHPNADKWTNARTLTLSGDLSGSVSIDGSSNVTLSASVANDSHTHETQYISKTKPYNDNILSGSIGGSDGKPLLQVNGASAYLGSTGRAGLQLATSTNPEWIGGGGAYKLFNDAYHPNADRWTTSRTLSLSGDASGSVSINGSSNVTLTVSVSDDSHNHTHSDGSFTVNGALISTGISSYDKIRVWSSDSYTIGMASGQSYGWLNDYAMTFTMNNDTDRGFLWRDVGDPASDGAMSLTTNGNLMVKNVIALGGDVSRYMSKSSNEGSWAFRSDNGKTWHFGSRSTSWVHNSTDATSGFYYYQSIQSAGNITAYSDARVKTNVERISNPLEKIERLNGYTYERTDVVCPRQTGVIAQEVLEVLPEAVVESGGDVDGHYAVAYGNMVGLLIEGIKEEKSKREALEKRLERLEKLLN